MFPLNPYNYNPFASSNFSDPLSVFRLNFPLVNPPAGAPQQGPAGVAGKAGAPGAPGGMGPVGAPGAPGAPAPAGDGTPSVTSTVGYPGVGGVDPTTGLPTMTDTTGTNVTSNITGWTLDPTTGNPVYNPAPAAAPTQGGYIDTTGGYLTTDPYFGGGSYGLPIDTSSFNNILAGSGLQP